MAVRSVAGSGHPYEDRVLVDEELGLFAIADGVTRSSQGNGAVAAELALSLLLENYFGDLASAVERVHSLVRRRRAVDKTIGETTLTAVAVSDGGLQGGNVGDSPAYLVSRGEVVSLVEEDRDSWGRITQVIGAPERIRVHSKHLRLKERDVVIIASDGVGHVLNPSMIDQFILKHTVEGMADAIIEEAKTVPTGYDDDKSVIVLREVT